MPNILQERLQQYMNWELSEVQGEFKKGRGTRDEIANICWITEKAKEFQKNIDFWFIDYTKALTVLITTNYGKFLKTWEYQTTSPAFWETHRSKETKKQNLESDMEHWTGSEFERSTSRLYMITLLI